jgi:hypothetical protein
MTFFMGWLRAFAAFAASVLVVVFGSAATLCLEVTYLAFPIGLERADGSQIDIPPWMPAAAWTGIGIVFGLVARRARRGALLILAPVAVVVCMVGFRVVPRTLGLGLRFDGP